MLVGREVATRRKLLKAAVLLSHSAATKKRLPLFMWRFVINKNEEVFFMKNTRVIILMGLLIALDVVLTRFLSIQLLTLRIGFGFIPVALAAIMFGPILGGVTAAAADIIGMMLFPNGAYFPGFTLSAFLSAAIYGVYLYRKPKSILRIGLAVLTIILIIDISLNTVWLTMLYNKAFFVILGPRVIKNLIMIPVQTSVIYVLWKYIGSFIESTFLNQKYEY